VDTEKSSGGSVPWSRFELDPLVLDVLGTPGGGELPTASVRVRRVEVVVRLDNPTCLTHDLYCVSVNCVDRPLHLEVLLIQHKGVIPFACSC